jgi:hypothetical protein
MRFFLGTHRPKWLRETTVDLFVSDRTLRCYKTLNPGRAKWSLDSGGFTELKDHGSWDDGPTPCEYASRIRRYRDHIGGLQWAAPQDWMCEPIIINGGVVNGQRFVGTRKHLDPYGILSQDDLITEHQRRTINNFIELRSIAPDLPIIPVIQGWKKHHYLNCLAMYDDAGIDLRIEPVVGIGSVCRREATVEAAQIIQELHTEGVRSLHGFGIKTSGLRAYGRYLKSSDSMAWSYAARKRPSLPGCVGHKNCANCHRYAFRWRERVLASLAGHTTRPTAPVKAITMSRKVDSPEHARRLMLSAFRDEAGRLERNTTIYRAHRDGMSIRAIAAIADLSPARVGQIVAENAAPLIDQLRDLRARWEVDTDYASAAAADLIIATLTDVDITESEPTAAASAAA